MVLLALLIIFAEVIIIVNSVSENIENSKTPQQNNEVWSAEVITDGKNELCFNISIRQFKDHYNELYRSEHGSDYLPFIDGWEYLTDEAGERYYSFSLDPKIESLPRISLYPSKSNYIRQVCISFDWHGYTAELYELYEELCFLTLKSLMPDTADDKMTEIFKSLNQTAYSNPNSGNAKPTEICFANGIGIYSVYPVGSTQKFFAVPLTDEALNEFEADGVKIYTIEQ